MEEQKKDYKKFIEETGADKMVDELCTWLKQNNNGAMPVWSDMIKEEDGKTYQYVNYVQEGGGVLGVGLIGYTYILEKSGIRFLKLAGTSAGAINTVLMASVEKENYKNTQHAFDYKSEIILQEMLDFDLWSMVDGSKFGKWLIKMFISKKNGLTVLRNILLFALITPVLFSIITLFGRVAFGIKPVTGLLHVYDVFATIAFIALVILLASAVIFLYYTYRFRKAGFGINKGNVFHKWIKGILSKNNIETSDQLQQKMESNINEAYLRPERAAKNIPGDADKQKPPFLTLVTSDVTNELKVEFPQMAPDYFDEPGKVNPADFVHASMAIPIFFEPFKVDVSAEVKQHSNLQQRQETIRRKLVSTYAVSFVDGGILSNFPFNVFHNPNIKIARIPTFGVRLDDKKHVDSTIPPGTSKRKLFPFLYKIFNTVRFNYDRDFLKKNSVYEMCIGHVDVADFNWLNFGIEYEEQKKLFIKGAEAAVTFLKGGKIWVDGKEKDFEAYNWELFKEERAKIVG